MNKPKKPWMNPWIQAVYESALDPALKPLAALCAAFADYQDGTRIFPSVERLAWMLGRRELRHTRRQLSALRAIGVLRIEPSSSLKGGRRRTVEYRLNVSALPVRPEFRSTGAREQRSAQIPDTQTPVSDSRRDDQNPDGQIPETRACGSINADVQTPRSSRDQSGDQRTENAREDARELPRSRDSQRDSQKALEEARANVSKLAGMLVRDRVDLKDLEACKRAAARTGLEYGGVALTLAINSAAARRRKEQVA